MPHSDYIGADGTRWPSVTEVLHAKEPPWVTKWKERIGEEQAARILAEANKIGTAFHLFAELLCKGKDVECSDQAMHTMLSRFETWRTGSGFVPRETELHVVSGLYKYHGTFDAIGTLYPGKKLFIFDWKTSKGIYPEMQLQLAAYAQAYYETTGLKIAHGYIINISKEGPEHKIRAKKFSVGKRAFNKFLKKLKDFNNLGKS